MEEPLSALLDVLRANGVRITVPRRAILESLVATGPHVTAEELAAHVRARHPEVHESTVYRTLDRLGRLGVVDHVHLGHGRAVFHVPGEAHQHLHCDSCGAVVEAPDELFAPLVRAVEERYGFELDLDHFALGGRCQACREAGASPRRGRRRARRGAPHHPSVPGPPLNGPTTSGVTQPP
ncbi:MAG TPA: Fur family transcriptional regulator [Acidimicrobiales bacterium]|nr:Fur family transcriptional regulator [Acidimicrobiales bacterium]